MAEDNNSLGNLATTSRRHTPNTPEREQFLQSLKTRIESGAYQVDADGLADKLLEELRPSEPEG